MKKKGATEADCKDLAKNTCKTVLDSVKNEQKVIDRQTTGQECHFRGYNSYLRAASEVRKTTKAWYKAKAGVITANDYMVQTPSMKFSLFKARKCGWIFRTKSYLTAVRMYNKAVTAVRVAKGQMREAHKVLKNAIYVMKRARLNCRCRVLKRRNSIWKTVNSHRSKTKQQKALSKCTMMSCVLNGTPLSSKKCKATLPKLKNKVLQKIIQNWTGACNKKWIKERHAKAVVAAEKNAKTVRKELDAKARERATKARERYAKQERASKETKAKQERAGKKAAEITYKNRKVLRCNWNTDVQWGGCGWRNIQNNCPGGYNWMAGTSTKFGCSWPHRRVRCQRRWQTCSWVRVRL